MIWIGLGLVAVIFLALVAVVVLKMVAWFSGFIAKIIMFGLKAVFFILGPLLLGAAVLVWTFNIQYALAAFLVSLALLTVLKALQRKKNDN